MIIESLYLILKNNITIIKNFKVKVKFLLFITNVERL